MSPDRVPVLILLVCVSTHVFTVQSGVGVNWGTTASHPLPPPIVVDLLKSNGIDKVRIFDADPPVLQALSGSNIKVTLGIPDLMLQALNMSVKAAESWIHDNVTRYVNGGVHILYIAVGENPFLQDYGEQFHTFVVGAATNIQIALSKAKLASEIKVVVPCSFDAFSSKSGLPSRGLFRSDINTTMVHLLSFLKTFMKGLMEHLRSKKGTPLRTGNPPVETFILSLLDEDQGSIASGDFERHWGVFTFDGLAKYQVDLGQGSRNLVNAQNVDYMPSKWCVVNNNKDLCNASLSAENACASADCTALSPGGSCSNISWPANVSYAFNSFFQKHDQLADSCDFGGLGLITTVDPSLDDCRFYIEIQTSRAASLAMSGLFDWMILLTITISAFFSSNLHGSRQY
uniref:X8 domain-containing protein n=1 Tax=Kalanchoe fedtschenkoi TaxID=63787 RepID=A0A7N0RDW8_KALFE